MMRGSTQRVGGPWLWSILGCALLWALTGVFSGHFSFQTLVVNASVASFLAIVAFGQMIVISGGDAAIDLSIPNVLTLAAFVSSGIMNNSDAMLIPALLACLALGLFVGLVNAMIVVLLRLPSIVVTLAMGYILYSVTLLYSNGFSSGGPSPILHEITVSNLAGIPVIVLITVALALIVGLVLHRSTYGRRLLAMGQSERAAHLAGINTKLVRSISFVLAGAFASIGGVALGAYNRGAFLEMGTPFLLGSIGAVVIGGTNIGGGRSTVAGTLGGALFLTLAITVMVLSKLAIGMREIVEGFLVILVLLVPNLRSASRTYRT